MEVRPKQMRLGRAAEMYDIKEAALQMMCLTKKVKAAKIGRLWYVTEKAMDDLFRRGENVR